VSTYLSASFFIAALVALWLRDHRTFPVLARKFLCIAPFLPIVSLLNHNLDHDKWGAAPRVLPMYVTLALLGVSLLIWRARGAAWRWGSEEICLLLYLVFCALQIPGSPDPAWSLSAWSWSAPGYLLFLMAGRATTGKEFFADKFPLFALLGFTGVSLALIVTGLVTGRAAELFNTRNFGSIYASNAMLLFLVLFVSLCWPLVRASLGWSFALLLVSLVCLLASLSRSAIAVVPVYLAAALPRSRAQWTRSALAVTLVCATLAAGLFFAARRVDLNAQLFDAWSARWYDGDYAGAYRGARQLRDTKFSYFHEEIWRDAPWHGQGYGSFRHFSEYTDAHDLLVTEAFENSLLATIFLVLAFSLPRVIRALFITELRPIAASILGFLFLGQVTGGMLAFRAAGHYYTAYTGWTLFYLVGFLSAQLRLRGQSRVASSTQDPTTALSFSRPLPQ
jgi:hypothetical protein